MVLSFVNSFKKISMKKPIICFFLGIPILIVTVLTCKRESPRSIDELSVLISRRINSIMTDYHVPGVSACAVKNGEIIWSGVYGYSNVSLNKKVTDTTLFMIGSISKTITGTALMQLIEQGLIGLDENINDYLSFRVVNPWCQDKTITPRMLLSHVSGIRDNWNILNGLHYNGGDSPLAIGYFLKEYLSSGGVYYHVANYADFVPGTQFEYTNVGSTLVAYLIESITKLSFEEYCQQKIFRPLGMNSTSWFLSKLQDQDIASPHVYQGGALIPIPHYGSPVYPCGFLRTSSQQFACYLNAIMNGGLHNGTRLLDENTVQMITNLHYPSVSSGYGLFWEYYGNQQWGHNGSGPGIASKMFFSCSEGIGIIVFSNIENTAAALIAEEIFYYLNSAH